MIQHLTQFANVLLPPGVFSANIGPGPSIETALQLPGGGAFDATGATQARVKLPYPVTYRGLQFATTAAALETALQALFALRGQRALLWRTLADGTQQYCTARLIGAPTEQTVSNRLHQPVELHFMVWSAWAGVRHNGVLWFDTGLFFDDGWWFDGVTTTLTTSPQTINLVNDGNADARAVTMTLTAGSAPITAVTVTIAGLCEWTYSGTLAAGQTLVVDCGALTVTNNGVGDWAHFDLTAGHVITDWLRLVANATTPVILTWTGGATDSTVVFDYTDTWE